MRCRRLTDSLGVNEKLPVEKWLSGTRKPSKTGAVLTNVVTRVWCEVHGVFPSDTLPLFYILTKSEPRRGLFFRAFISTVRDCGLLRGLVVPLERVYYCELSVLISSFLIYTYL